MFCKSHWLRPRVDNTGRKSHKGFNGVFSMKDRKRDFYSHFYMQKSWLTKIPNLLKNDA